MCIGDCRRRVSVHPLSFEQPTARTHIGNWETKIMKNILDDISQSEHNILLFYGDRQAIKDLKLSVCYVPLFCYLDDVMWGLWNNYNTYIVNLLAYMTANLMPVCCHVPTKFELQYMVIDRDANQTTKMRSCFGCYRDALEIFFGLYDLLLELCSL